EELQLIIDNLLEKQQKRIDYLKDLLYLRQEHKSMPDINEMDLNLIKNLQMLVLDSKSKFSIDELAKKLYISRAQLHRKLIALTGMSTTHYINYIRIEKAKHLLSTTNLRVKEVAYTVGFESTTYFSKLFKKELGVTPTSYRNEST
ncbi:MAG TPA: helix-turn-helix transcriptional regulator, partial [Flavobacteriaceae bacterium]|nr:helix-turn-helix transcriptional regulator [Flavobacteriaceae bacterium]